MKLIDLQEARIPTRPDEIHDWIEFIYEWYAGHLMGRHSPKVLTRWKRFREMFPTGLQGEITLYRLVTIPTKWVKPKMRLKPAPGRCSSWSLTSKAIQYVAGIAQEFTSKMNTTSRVSIEAKIPAEFILATPKSVAVGFDLFSKDYHERYPEQEIRRPSTPEETKRWGGPTIVNYTQPHPDWPKSRTTMDFHDVGFLRGQFKRVNGYHSQNECIVESPKIIDAKLIKIFRQGQEILDQGWEE